MAHASRCNGGAPRPRARASLVVLAGLCAFLCLPRTARSQSSDEGGTAPASEPGSDPGPHAGATTPADELPVYEETTTVTASRTEESLIDSPASVTVIGRDRIENAPSRSFADLLRGVPGLNVVQLSSRDVNVTARGATGVFASTQLMLVDGHPVMSPSSGIPLWDLVTASFDEIERVEIVRGPASSVWGSNALTSVVNVRTLSPRDDVGTRVELGLGLDEFGERLASVRHAQAGAKYSWRIGASYDQQDAFDRVPELPDGSPLPAGYGFDSSGTKQPRFDVRVDRQRGTGDRALAWSYRAGYSRTSGPIYSFTGPFEFEPETDRATAQVRADGKRMSLVVAWEAFDGVSTSMLGAGSNAFAHDTLSIDLSSSRLVGQRQIVAFGGSLTFDSFDLDAAPDQSSRNAAALFVEDQVFLDAHEKATLHAGLRVDHYDTFGTALSPRLALVFKPRPNHSLRLAGSRAFRAPTLLESYLSVNTASVAPLPPNGDPFLFPILATGNASLDPTSSEGFELAWTAELGGSSGDAADRHHAISAALYRNVREDIVDFYPSVFYTRDDPPPGWPLPPEDVDAMGLPKVFSYRNVGRLVDEGVELGVESWWKPGISTTFSWTHQRSPDVSKDDPIVPMRVNLPPSNQFSGTLRWSRGRASGLVALNWVDEAYWCDVLDQRFFGTTSSYLLVDASARVKLESGRSEVAVNVTNLLDDDVQQHVFGDVIPRRIGVSWARRF